MKKFFVLSIFLIVFAFNVSAGEINSIAQKFFHSVDKTQESARDLVNVSPIARIKTNSFLGVIPFKTSFDGSKSSDPDGEIVDYKWRIQKIDSDKFEEYTGNILSYTFNKEGVFHVTLTVTDDKGAKDTTTITVYSNKQKSDSIPVKKEVKGREANLVPLAIISKDKEKIRVGSTVFFSAEKSKDFDGQIVKYEWDFGDGEKGEGIEVSHTFNTFKREGYIIVLSVTDNDGGKTHAYTNVFFEKSFPALKKCIDSDNGVKIYSPGKVTEIQENKTTEYLDNCTGKTSIREYACAEVLTQELETIQSKSKNNDSAKNVSENALKILLKAMQNPGVPVSADGLVWPAKTELKINPKTLGLKKDNSLCFYFGFDYPGFSKEFVDSMQFDLMKRVNDTDAAFKMVGYCDKYSNIKGFAKNLKKAGFEWGNDAVSKCAYTWQVPEQEETICLLTPVPSDENRHESTKTIKSSSVSGLVASVDIECSQNEVCETDSLGRAYCKKIEVQCPSGQELENGLCVPIKTQQKPVLNANVFPLEGFAPLKVVFDASKSYSPNGRIVEYFFDFGDNNTLTQTVTGSETFKTSESPETQQLAVTTENPAKIEQQSKKGYVEHIYNAPGSYVATIRVSDNMGLSSQGRITITVKQKQVFKPLPEELNVCSETGVQALKKYGFDKLLFRWGFNDIYSDTCSAEVDGYYCDLTQLSIFLVKRIAEFSNYVEKLALDDPEIAQKLERVSTLEELYKALQSTVPIKTSNETTIEFAADPEKTPLFVGSNCSYDYSPVWNSLREKLSEQAILTAMNSVVKSCFDGKDMDSSNVLVLMRSGTIEEKENLYTTNNSEFNQHYDGYMSFSKFLSLYGRLENKYGFQKIFNGTEFRVAVKASKNTVFNVDLVKPENGYDFVYTKNKTPENFSKKIGIKHFFVLAKTIAFNQNFKEDFKEYFTLSPESTTAKNSLGDKYYLIQDFNNWVLPGNDAVNKIKPGSYAFQIDAKVKFDSSRLKLFNIKVNGYNNSLDLPFETSVYSNPDFKSNPFFYIPFEGSIGLKKGRIGYGYGASIFSRKEEDPNFFLYKENGEGYVVARPDGGLIDLSVSKEEGFTSQIQQGFVLVAGVNPKKTQASIKQYHSFPIGLELSSMQKNFSVFYGFLKGSALFEETDYEKLGLNSEGKKFLFTWFDEKGNKVKEELKTGLKGFCSGWNEARTLAQLNYPVSTKINGVAFVPKNARLGVPCTEQNALLLASFLDGTTVKTELSPEQWFGGSGQAIDIGRYSSSSFQSFQETLEDYLNEVKNGRICVSSQKELPTVNKDFSTLLFRWNPEAFIKPKPLKTRKEFEMEIIAEREPPYFVGDIIKFEVKPKLEKVKYYWSFTDSPTAQTITGTSTVHEFKKRGSFTVIVDAVEDKPNGKLLGTKTRLVIVLEKPLFAVQIITDKQQPFLVDDTITFTAVSELGESVDYEWFFSDTPTVFGKKENPIKHSFKKIGSFKVTVIAKPKSSDLFAEKIGKGELIVSVIPKAVKPTEKIEAIQITSNPTQPFFVREKIVFTANSRHADTVDYEWVFSDQPNKKQKTGNTITHAFNKKGFFTVKVTALKPKSAQVQKMVGQGSLRVQVIEEKPIEEEKEKISHILPDKLLEILEKIMQRKEKRIPSEPGIPGEEVEKPSKPEKPSKKISHILPDKLSNVLKELEKQKKGKKPKLEREPGLPIDTGKPKEKPSEKEKPEKPGKREEPGKPGKKEKPEKPEKKEKPGKEIRTGRILPGKIIEGLIEKERKAKTPKDKNKPKKPVQEFSLDAAAEPTSGTAPLTVTFTAKTNMPKPLFEWHFGDATYIFGKTGQTVTHTYKRKGTFTAFVLLKKNLFGKVIARKNITIVVEPKIKTIEEKEKEKIRKTLEKEKKEREKMEEIKKEKAEKKEKPEKEKKARQKTGRQLGSTLSDSLSEAIAKKVEEREDKNKVEEKGFELTVTTVPDPPQGEVPLTVTFIASSNLDPNVKYEWHFSQDLLQFGIAGDTVTRTYRKAGTYQARVIAKTKGLFGKELGRQIVTINVLPKTIEGKKVFEEKEKTPSKKEREQLCNITITSDSEPPFLVDQEIVLSAKVDSREPLKYVWYFNNQLFGVKGNPLKHVFRREGIIKVEVYGKENKLFASNKCYGKTFFEVKEPEKIGEEIKEVIKEITPETSPEKEKKAKQRTGRVLTDVFTKALEQKKQAIEKETSKKIIEPKPGETEKEAEKRKIERELLEITISTDPDPAVGMAPLTVVFTAENNQNLDLKYEWRFGDGSTLLAGPKKNPVKHTYTRPGKYIVKVKAKTRKLISKKVGEAFTVVTVTGEQPKERESITEQPPEKERIKILEVKQLLRTGYILPDNLANMLERKNDLKQKELSEKEMERKQKIKEENKKAIEKALEGPACGPCTDLLSCKACIDMDLYSDLFTK